MEAKVDLSSVARDAAQDALSLCQTYGRDEIADVLRTHAASFIFMLARVAGTDVAVAAIQQISRRFVSRETEKIRLAVDNTRGVA